MVSLSKFPEALPESFTDLNDALAKFPDFFLAFLSNAKG